MSGEHTHPECADAQASLRADLIACAARLRSLEGAVAGLIGQVEALEAPADVWDYAPVVKPAGTLAVGRDWTRLDTPAYDPPRPGWQSTLVYVNLSPKFRTGKTIGALRIRIVRADGDTTAFHDYPVSPDTLDGDGAQLITHTYWESIDGTPTVVDLRCVGGLASVTLSTRYVKRCTVVDHP